MYTLRLLCKRDNLISSKHYSYLEFLPVFTLWYLYYADCRKVIDTNIKVTPPANSSNLDGQVYLTIVWVSIYEIS